MITKSKVFYSIAFLINVIALSFTLVRIESRSYLLVFFLLPIMSLIVLFQYYEKTLSKFVKTILIVFSTCLLPFEALLLLTNQSVENWFIEIDKTVFFFVYYKKTFVILFLLPLILSGSTLGKYLKNKSLSLILAFLFAVMVLFVYNAV
ncbi:MAG: hypothetical protein VB126_03435 [Paludibacter sp.]|nr:hypothetical protein [Paludibacter sp.]